MVYAGFWRRLTAFLVDALVLLPALWLYFQAWRVSPIAALVATLGLGILSEAYMIYCHARWGQTIGKMVTRIQVVQPDGAPITPRHAWLRNSVEIAIWLIGIPSMAYVLLTWNGPEWTSVTPTFVDQGKLLAERDPMHEYTSNLGAAWQGSEFIVLLFNKKRRALHDFIAGTVVVLKSGS